MRRSLRVGGADVRGHNGTRSRGHRSSKRALSAFQSVSGLRVAGLTAVAGTLIAARGACDEPRPGAGFYQKDYVKGVVPNRDSGTRTGSTTPRTPSGAPSDAGSRRGEPGRTEIANPSQAPVPGKSASAWAFTEVSAEPVRVTYRRPGFSAPGAPEVLSISLVINAADGEKAFGVIRDFATLLASAPFSAGTIYLVGADFAIYEKLTELITPDLRPYLEVYDRSEIVTQFKDDGLDLTTSPAWIVQTRQGRIVLEGVRNPAPYLSGGQFKVPEGEP